MVGAPPSNARKTGNWLEFRRLRNFVPVPLFAPAPIPLVGRFLQTSALRAVLGDGSFGRGTIWIYEGGRENYKGTRIKVIGVGGGGCDAVSRLVREGLDMEFHAMEPV